MQNQKSTFVTVLAWIFIVLSGYGLVIGVFQNILVNTAFPIEMFEQNLPKDNSIKGFPFFFFEHFRLFILAISFIQLFQFITSIALLKRKEWARVTFIAFLSIGILFMVGGTIFYQIFLNNFNELGDPMFTNFALGFRVFSVVLTLLFCALFTWIIARLSSSTIKDEFINNSSLYLS